MSRVCTWVRGRGRVGVRVGVGVGVRVRVRVRVRVSSALLSRPLRLHAAPLQKA